MKNETARREIESLDYYLQNHTDDYSEESHTAMMMAIKALEQQPSEEDIHREREQAYMLGYEDASKRFRTEPCEDCISREAMLLLQTEYAEKMGATTFWELRDDIRALPSVKLKYTDEEIDKAQAVEQAYVDKMVGLAVKETERPRGKWINKFGKEQGYDIAGIKTWYIQIMCDKCGFIKTAIEGHTGQYKYCPNCGAEMSGGGEE